MLRSQWSGALSTTCPAGKPEAGKPKVRGLTALAFTEHSCLRAQLSWCTSSFLAPSLCTTRDFVSRLFFAASLRPRSAAPPHCRGPASCAGGVNALEVVGGLRAYPHPHPAPRSNTESRTDTCFQIRKRASSWHCSICSHYGKFGCSGATIKATHMTPRRITQTSGPEATHTALRMQEAVSPPA